MAADKDLERAIEEIADGVAVDWLALESRLEGAEDREYLKCLRILGEIAEAHRSTEQDADSSPSTGQAASEESTEERVDMWGRYQLFENVGQGTFGSVYRAWDPELERELAIKILHEQIINRDLKARLLGEGRALARISHPNVVRVVGVESHGDRIGLCMEFIRGETLEAELRKRRAFSAREAALVGEDVCRALAAVHAAGFVHRDVKARNVMREQGGRIVLMDFGTGRESEHLASAGRLGIAGTPVYMAPEVLNGDPATPASDIYSVGVLLYHMLTLRYPAEGATVDELQAAHEQQRITPITDLRPDLPPRIVQVIGHALHPDPTSRPRSAGAMQQELLNLAEHGAPVSRVRQALAKSRGLQVAAAVLLVALLAAPLVWMSRVRGDQPSETLLLPDRRILVVLPFKVIGERKEERLYSEGVSEILTSSLVQLGVPDLQVMPATQIGRAQGTIDSVEGIDTIEKARAEFGATLVLAGVIQFSGSQVRVSYSLIRAADRRELISRANTVPVGDPFAVQDFVTRDALAMLKVGLAAAPKDTRQVLGTANPDAAYLYTQARGALQNYDKQENVDEAIRLLTEAVDRDPQFAPAYAALGRAYWENFSTSKEWRWLDQADEACEKSVSLNPKLSEAQQCRGLVQEGRGEYELAAESYQRAIELPAGNDDAHSALGSVLYKLNRVDEAEAAYKKAIDLRPGYWAGYARIAQFYTLRNDFGKASEYYGKALELSPDNARVLYSLGLVFTNHGEYDRAAQTLERAIQVRPYLASPYTNLGLAYLRARRYNQAIAPLEKAFSVRPDYQTGGNLARIYWLSGRKDEARQKYEFAVRDGELQLQRNQRDHGIHLLVGRYYAMLGNRAKALSHIGQALVLHPDDAHYLAIAATAYVQLGDGNAALGLMEQAARLGHTSAQFLGEPELDVLKADRRYAAVMSVNGPGR